MKIIQFLSFIAMASCSSPKFVEEGAHVNALYLEAKENFKSGLNNISYFGKEKAPDAVIMLGQKLFFDPRLSRDGTVSCSHCHLPQLSFSDGLQKSRGTEDLEAPRNAQTILNTAGQFMQHWIGDRETVEAQAFHSFTVKVPFALRDNEHLKEKLIDAHYGKLFSSVFDGLDLKKTNSLEVREKIAFAIGAYERSLVGPSRFDDFLSGEVLTLTTQELRGLKKFMEFGCSSCHSGPLIGGEMFQKFGVFEDYWKYTKSSKIDFGRFLLTKDEDEKYYFKVPPLRNVVHTAPYFHDGSVARLEEAIKIMGKVQLGLDLEDGDVEDVKSFLNSLSTKDEFIAKFNRIPILPNE